MITSISEETRNIINSPVRQVEARVELYTSAGIETEEEAGTTLINTFPHNGALISFTVDRVGDESKFFGFGIFQKINVKLRDLNREIDINTSHYLRVVYTVNNEEIVPYPYFKVSEVHRDELTNELSITGYDALNATKDRVAPITELNEFIISKGDKGAMLYWLIDTVANILNTPKLFITFGDWIEVKYYDISEINLDESDTFKDVLDAMAEITHSIYFINGDNRLVFKSLLDAGETQMEVIDKSKYFSLDTKENRKFSKVMHITELNDNISASTGSIGTTQYLRDNPFISLDVEKATTILNDIIAEYGDFTINQFECEWRGNPALEPLDKLFITTNDNETVISYVINDTIEYNGALAHKISWNYEANDDEESGEPTSLGDVLKQTIAKVDKANNEIVLLAKNTKEEIDNVSGEVESLTKSVEAKLDANSFQVKIEEVLGSVDAITTTTGFTFSNEGLNISKSNSDISTLIDENGMDISIGDEKVLTADNSGVNAINLTARKYLIVGNYSRFEDYGERTGCFWVGG